MTTSVRSGSRSARRWSPGPMSTAERQTALGPAYLTVVGGSVEIAVTALDALAELLGKWDLNDPRSELSGVWQSEPVAVSDDTLLLLALTTDATVDLESGVARLDPGQSPPAPALMRALAIDMAVHDLEFENVAGVHLTVGSDAAARGTAPQGGWPMQVLGSATTLRDGAVMTVRGAADTDVAAVAVRAGTAWQAATRGLAAVTRHGDDAVTCLEDAGVAALVLGRGGTSTVVGDWPDGT